MSPEVITGLTIFAILLVASWAIIAVCTFLMDLSANLGAWIFHSNGPVLLRMFAIIPWVPLLIFRLFFLIVGFVCAILLLGDIKKWLKK